MRMQDDRLRVVAFDLCLDPLLLHLCESVIIRQLFLFKHVSANDHRLKEVHGKLAPDEDERDKENSSDGIVILPGNMIYISRVDCLQHNIVPTLCRRNLKQDKSAVEDVIETIFMINPLTSRTDAVPLCVNTIH